MKPLSAHRADTLARAASRVAYIESEQRVARKIRLKLFADLDGLYDQFRERVRARSIYTNCLRVIFHFSASPLAAAALSDKPRDVAEEGFFRCCCGFIEVSRRMAVYKR